VDDRLRWGTEDDREALWRLYQQGFGVPDRGRERWIGRLVPERALVVDGAHGELAAAAQIRSFHQAFGGRAVPLAGYSPVAVAAEHRGRGLAKAVMVGHYADLRDRGEVIAGLFPASVALYRSVGFEVAGSYVQRRVPAAHLAAIAVPAGVEVRRGSADDVAAVHRCYGRLALEIDGSMLRTPDAFAARLPPDLADTYLYVVDDPATPGELAGYALYRHGTARPPYDYSVVVAEVHADSPDRRRALWRVVGSSGTQAPVVEMIGPAEDPLWLLVGAADPEAVRSEIRWMLRLIDAPGAVAARGWNPTVRGSVDLAVTDEHAPWNAGRWRLTVEDGEGRLEPGGEGTVAVSIQGLSCWWSGYLDAHALARAGLVETPDPRALATFAGLGVGSPPTLVDFY